MKRLFVLAAVLVSGLAACAPADVVFGPTDTGRQAAGVQVDAIKAAVDGVDWAAATPITIRIRQNDFDPMVVSMRAGKPYTLTLVNGDDKVHAFVASEFFAETAVKSLEPAETPFTPGGLLVSVLLEPGATRKVELVPLRDGTYEFIDGVAGVFLPGSHVSLLNRLVVGATGYLVVRPNP